MRLNDKVAVITGAGQRQGERIGNGRATAMLFACEGTRLVLANRSIASAEETRDLLRKEGADALCVATDVSKSDECSALARAVVSKLGRLNIPL
jgi:NAD(P)-dependent dehydrogenase (short-subunit alcohol dehydrogenase family)